MLRRNLPGEKNRTMAGNDLLRCDAYYNDASQLKNKKSGVNIFSEDLSFGFEFLAKTPRNRKRKANENKRAQMLERLCALFFLVAWREKFQIATSI